MWGRKDRQNGFSPETVGSERTFFLQPRTFMGLFLAALGLMMIFEGIPYFCAPSLVKNFAQKIPETPNSTLRIIGFILMLLGLAIVYLGRRYVEGN